MTFLVILALWFAGIWALAEFQAWRFPDDEGEDADDNGPGE